MEPLPCSKSPVVVMVVSPFEPPESSLDKDVKLFVQEEDDLGETIELPTQETSS
jgi:hypothetical protein